MFFCGFYSHFYWDVSSSRLEGSFFLTCLQRDFWKVLLIHERSWRGEVKWRVQLYRLISSNYIQRISKWREKEEFLKVYSGFCSSVLMPRKRRWNDSPLICFRFHCWGAQESIVKVKIQVDIVQQYKTNLIHFSAESWLVQKNIL